ncbi:MAG: Uma2 family endonuclease [Anaerolineae bacterium]|nr:Uma2 family endonuclease [Anaerolineae bacterium]
MPATRIHTVEAFEQFLSLPENRDRHFELIDGAIVEKAMPTEEHGLTVGLWITFLNLYGMERGIGLAGTEHRFRVPGDETNARQPDISMILETESPITTKGATQRAPDVIVEVKSPDDRIQDMRDRAAWYLANGVKLVFLHFPRQQFVEAHRPGHDIEIIPINETISGYDVLPGFSLPAAKVFPQTRGG